MAVSGFQKFIEKRWYGEPGILNLLRPLEVLYAAAAKSKQKAALKKQKTLPVPVLVVGNITVGGTGKTPTIICLLKFFLRQGYKPAVISRGYGRKDRRPYLVNQNSTVADAGDEALLIFRETACPVALHHKRLKAARLLLTHHPDCDVLLADDGLQHYALQRDLELVLIDGKRLFGNGHQLPLGPLREPTSRLEHSDWLLVNKRHQINEQDIALHLQNLNWQFCELRAAFFQAISSGERIEIKQFQEKYACETLCAMTAIGYPDDFYASLDALGLQTKNESYPDHFQWSHADVHKFSGKALICTSKDAVKLQQLIEAHPAIDAAKWYVLETEMYIPETLKVEIAGRLQKCIQQKKQTARNA